MARIPLKPELHLIQFPRFDTSGPCYLDLSIRLHLLICILKVIGRVWEKSMKYNSTTEIQIRAFRLGKAMRM